MVKVVDLYNPRYFLETNNIKTCECGCGCGNSVCETCGKAKVQEVYDPEYEHDTDNHVVKHKDDNDQNFWAVYNGDGKIVKVFYNEKKAKDYAEKNHDALMKNKIVSENVLVEMKLRTSPIPDGSKIPPYTTIFAHKDSIWVATPDEWKENRQQITDEINQSLGITDNPMPVSYTGEGLYDVITERNIRDILVFIKYDDDLIYHRSAFKQSPQTSPLFKKVGKFLSQKFDLTTDEMSIFTMGVGQQGFTNDKVDPDSLKGSLPTVGYHGTNIDALQSILKKGIMPQDSGNYGEIHTPGYVFFAADNSKILQAYAGQSAGGIWTPSSIPLTVHFKIPDQTKIRPDVDVAHDLYGGDEAKRINPDYKHLDFPDKARTPTKSKRPEKKWQHAEVFGYKGRIPASHIIGISMPQKYGGPNTSIEQVIENIKAWNVLKTKFDPKDIVYSKATWAGKTAEQIIKDETAEQENPTVREEITDFNPQEPMSSTVAVQGYGTMNLSSLMKNIASTVKKLGELRGDPASFRSLNYELYDNGVLQAKLAALITALDQLQEIKRKGGKRSVNIQREANQVRGNEPMPGKQKPSKGPNSPHPYRGRLVGEAEQAIPQAQPLPVDLNKIVDQVQELEVKRVLTAEEADDLRREIRNLATSRKTLEPIIILQYLTLLSKR